MNQSFKSGMIVKSRDFCERNKSIKELISHIESNNRCYLYGERRVGKSSLVYETARRLNKNCITVDFLGVKTETDVCRRLVKAIICHNQTTPTKLYELLKQFTNLRPQLGIDSMTGLPTVGIASSQKLTIDDIESAFTVLSKYKDSIIFFDEFQDILELKTSDTVLAIMRSKIQVLSDLSFIFAGSIRNAMLDIFTLDSSPFFKSAFPLNVIPIEEEIFNKFIKRKFTTSKRKVSEKVLHKIYSICNGIPGDIQKLCASLVIISNDGDTISIDILSEGLKNIFTYELLEYERILHSVSSQQLKTLLALAEIGGESKVTQELVLLTGIPLAGSVNKAMKSLYQKRVVSMMNNVYKFSNPFFKSWLITRNI